MTYNEIINAIKDDAVLVAINKNNIYPSKIIGMCLYLYKHNVIDDDDIIVRKNPLGQKNPYTLEKLSFDSIYDGLINSVYDEFINGYFYGDELDRIIKVWNLKVWDLEYVKTVDRIMIDLDEDQKIPFIDQYTIWDNNTIVLVTSSLEEAKDMSEKNPSYTVTNSKGKLINFKPKKVSSDKSVESLTLTAGTKVVCTNVNMYESYTDTRPTRILNGVFYIYNGKNCNDMYQLCQKKIINNEDIVITLGYVKLSDLIKK